MKPIRTIVIFGSIAILLGFGLVHGHKTARTHVNYITAVEDHPITCWSCHLYKQKDNFIAKFRLRNKAKSRHKKQLVSNT